jgi:hypothetical protein
MRPRRTNCYVAWQRLLGGINDLHNAGLWARRMNKCDAAVATPTEEEELGAGQRGSETRWLGGGKI